MKTSKHDISRVVFLGPYGSTFSHEAYDLLSRVYGSPRVSQDARNYIPAESNNQVVELAVLHGGYASLAMETKAEGRVSEPLEAFIRLIDTYESSEVCPLDILGSSEMRIGFCLMCREDTDEGGITRWLGHPKAFGACKKLLAESGCQSMPTSSNGEAARLIAHDPAFSGCAALGPAPAAAKYGLRIMKRSCEDSEAITTFFLLGPKGSKPSVGIKNRALLVFRLSHEPGSLMRALGHFYEAGLNMLQIHSAYTGNEAYDFAIEIDVPGEKISVFKTVVESFSDEVLRHICFGPFEKREV